MPPSPAAIDVVVTAYNSESTLQSSVESLLHQSFHDIRVVMVDDGSTDGTRAIMEQLSASDPRVCFISVVHGGITAAANAGLALCNADFIARLDSDDIALPERLERQIDFMRTHEDCVAVSCLAYHIDPSGHRMGSSSEHGDPDHADPRRYPSIEPYIMHPFVMFRRDALLQAGFYRHLDYAEDTDLYWRLFDLGKFKILPEFLGEYRMHPDSISSKSIRNGRISAVSSQLSAISATRRREGRGDLDFTCERQQRCHEAVGDFQRVIDVGSEGLDHTERAYLQLAAVTKLLQLNSYRPYELDNGDCRVVRTTLVGRMNELGEDWPEVERLWGLAWARLLRKGYFDRARLLFHPAILTAGMKNLAIQVIAFLLPVSIRKAYRRRRYAPAV